MRKNNKGQGMTEFALILPLLLLLLLGIIEASRVIWAYITVQTAAREAARYAVTGRPYLDSNNSIESQLETCLGNAGEESPIKQGTLPWLCEPEDRVDAIQKIAIRRGDTLNISNYCDQPDEYVGACSQRPGAFGVFVRGQTVTDTMTGTQVIVENNYPGDQGLNVEVSTFYNVEMITPIFNALMGGNAIRLEGRVQLQNEGLDLAVGIDPPPGIEQPDPGQPPPGTGGTTSAKIWSLSGYKVSASDLLRVRLENHASPGPYDIALYDSSSSQLYEICSNVTTDLNDRAESDCDLTLVPPGLYDLVSLADGSTSPFRAVGPDQVEVVVGGTPKIVVDGGNIWAAGEETFLTLHFHDIAKGPYSLQLLDGSNNLVETFESSASGSSSDTVDWTPADLAAGGWDVCDLASAKSCKIRSLDKDGNLAATVEVNINQPILTLAADSPPYKYARGEEMRISLSHHTPAHRYNIKITDDGTGTTTNLGATLDTNAVGDTVNPLAWTIPLACGGVGGDWPDGTYTLTSHPLGGSSQIAIKQNVIIETPADPYLTVDGGYTWPAGWTINIRVINHEVNARHYLTFGGERVPISGSSDNTFETGGCGQALVQFTIPASYAESDDVPLRSYLVSNDTNPQASRTIDVLKDPVIRVVEGSTVLPDQIITIELVDHVPHTGYRIKLADQEIFSVKTDETGKASFKFDLSRLALNEAEVYQLWSEDALTGGRAATTELTLLGADLVVTKVEVPDLSTMNSDVPVKVTVKNVKDVAIQRWVDIDLYLNPSPIAPSYLKGYNFPGDIKYWKNSIAPQEEFVITHTFEVDRYGTQPVYGYVDTSAVVFEQEKPNEANNPNNIGNDSFLVPCTNPEFIDTFDGSGSLPAGWSSLAYGNARGTESTSVDKNTLTMVSRGQSTWTDDDNSRNKGLFYVYRTEPVDTTGGLDVVVQAADMDPQGDWAEAGIEIRASLESDSPKVGWAIAPNKGKLHPTFRHENGGMNRAIGGDSNYSKTPVWLRVTREPGTQTFYYFARETNKTPPLSTDDPATIAAWWGDPKAYIDVSGMDNEVYVGLYHASYDTDNDGTVKFKEFRVKACEGTGQQEEYPPGYRLCTEGLEDRSFEQRLDSPWQYSKADGVTVDFNFGKTGLNSLRAATFDGTVYQPFFSQKFIMPTWVVSDATTFELSLQRNVVSVGHGSQENDKFYVVVATTNNPNTWIPLTDPVEVANGETETEGAPDPAGWNSFKMTLPVTASINLEDYASTSSTERELYINFFNNSNSVPTCSPYCATKFYFDDISLNTCTEQKLREPLETHIKGLLTLNYSDGTSGVLPNVKVWAYAEDDNTVYETVSRENGEFDFYNLPASDDGITYTIFAQYHLIQGTQMETLAAESSRTLKTGQQDETPSVFLDLYSLEPLP